jgi:uncharacterized membrane protein YkvI
MSPWVPIVVTPILSGLLVFATQTYNKVTTPDETKEHLRKLKSWAFTICRAVLITVQVALLIREVTSREPLTRLAVFSIASLVGSIYFLVQSFLDTQTLKLIGRILNVQDRQLDLQDRLIGLAEDEAAKR